jgi:hypothetical protein
MSIRRLGDAQLYGPTSQATASYPAGVMLSAADYAAWQHEAGAANAATYAATVAAYTAMTPAAQPAAQHTTPVPVLLPVPVTPPAAPPAIAPAAAIPEWVYWGAAAAGLFLISKLL